MGRYRSRHRVIIMKKSHKKEWYKRPWGITAAILFLPFFAVWYAWAESKWNTAVKVAVTVVSSLFVVAAFASGGIQPSSNPTTSTSAPLTTAAPKATAPAPRPKPKVYRGSGDDVVKIQKPDGAAIITFKCPTCTDNTAVQTNGAESLIVNTIGPYSGSHIIDMNDGSATSKVTITASGAWVLTVSDLSSAIRVGGKTVKGNGDAVLHIIGTTSEATITNLGDANFSVNVYSDSGNSDLPVNTIGSYKGTVPLEGPGYVQIESNGSWTITARE